MRILIVEDDVALGLFLAKGLTMEGHAVEVVGDGESALRQVMKQAPDLMVLDLSLPQKDGLEVLKDIAGRAGGMSVLVLTGRNGLADRVSCLNLGADDCLLKPFSFSELTARVGALTRRRERFASPVLRMGALELNRMERTVRQEGRTVELTVKEFALLEYLMMARGRTCLRSELLREVWQAMPAAGTNVVDVYVNYLRKKLGGGGQVIETVRGEGYAMVTNPGPAAVWGMEGGLGSGVWAGA